MVIKELNIFTGDDLSVLDVEVYSFHKYGRDEITMDAETVNGIISSWISGGWVRLANETSNKIMLNITNKRD